jgi:DNA-binding NtrC family response regulator
MVVEDDASLASALESFLAPRADLVRVAATRAEAARQLADGRVDAALVDLALPDGSGVELLELLWAQTIMPHVIVISGSAAPDTAFQLAQRGVRAFVSKPLSLQRLETAWEVALGEAPDLRPMLRASVGHVPLRTMEDAVRRSMTEEALAMAGSSRRRASRVLGISRQLLQHILRDR